MRDTFREDDEDDEDRDGKEAFAKFDEPTRIEGEGGVVDPDPGDRDSVGHTEKHSNQDVLLVSMCMP